MADFTFADQRYFPYDIRSDGTRFLLQTDSMTNFNQAIMQIRSGAFINAPIWDHEQLYLERVWVWYKATDAGTTVSVFANTGYSPLKSISPPIAWCPSTVAGKYNLIDSGEVKIPINSSSAAQGPAADQGIIVVETYTHNAADDMYITLQGWFSDSPVQPQGEYIAPVEPDPQPVTITNWPWKRR